MPDVPVETTQNEFPKRGAIPTPKSEIERAPKYIPEGDQAPATEPVPPTNDDQKEKSEEIIKFLNQNKKQLVQDVE